MAKLFHVGEKANVKVKMTDASGHPTPTYDEVSGIEYTADHPDQVSVVDEDAEPRDAVVEFLGLTEPGMDSFIRVRFDGDPGDGIREIPLVSEAFQVVPGAAVAGELTLELIPEA